MGAGITDGTPFAGGSRPACPTENRHPATLYDAQIHTMATLGMTITGTEIIDGVAYAQSWHCRVV